MAGTGWSTIESDPGVFTALAHDFGARGAQIEEIVTMDESEFSNLAPVYGLIFLFKWTQEMAQAHKTSSNCVEDSNLYFAKQVTNNACGTQALLNIMMNAKGLELGKELNEFKDFTADFPADLKGEAMSNSEMLRSCHNSFARPEPFEMEQSNAGKEDDVYHFTTYMPVGGKLYELDGLQSGPILLGDCVSDDSWYTQVVPIIQERIARYQSSGSSELRFNLLAVCRNQREHCKKELSQVSANMQLVSAALMSHGEDAAMDDDDDDDEEAVEGSMDLAGKTVPQLKECLSECKTRRYTLRQKLADENEKADRYTKENARRRHNFIPFIMQLLQGLAQRDKLAPLVASATERAKTRAAAAKAKGEE